MTDEPEIRREIADERRELTEAVASLREELGQTAARGKRVGVTIGTVTAAALVGRLVFRLARRRTSSD